MSEPPDTRPNADAMLQPYFDFWSGLATQAGETTQKMLHGAAELADGQALQRRWLAAVSRSADAYLRSPPFLHAMKQTLDAAIQAQSQTAEIQEQFARSANLATTSDLSEAISRLQAALAAILARLDVLERELNRSPG